MNHAAFPGEYWRASRPLHLSVRPGVAGSQVELWLAAAAMFLAPFNILRVDAFYFTASDTFVLAAVFGLVLGRSLPLAPQAFGTWFWNLGIVLLCGALLLSSLLRGDPERGFIVSAQYLYAYFLMAFVILSRSRTSTVVLLEAFVASIALMCLHGIIVVDVLKEHTSTMISGSGRFVGWVERENECATVIALAAPLLLWLASSGSIKRWWLWILLPIYAYGVVLTGSNTGLIGLVFAIGMFVIAAGSLRQIIAVGISSVMLASLVLTWGQYFLPAVFQRRVLGALQTGDIDEAGTFDGRMQLIHEAIGKIGDVGLLGIGADQYRHISAFGNPVHNTYLLLWVEAGPLGLIGFLLLLLTGLTIGAVALGKREGRLAAVCTLTSVMLFAMLANALPALYGRFLIVPLLLGMAPSIAVLRENRLGRSRQ